VTWLTETVYHQPLSGWLWDAARWALLPAGGFLVLLVGWAAWPTAAEREGAEHVRGVHLLTPLRLHQHLAGGAVRWWHRRPHAPQGLQVAGVAQLVRLADQLGIAAPQKS